MLLAVLPDASCQGLFGISPLHFHHLPTEEAHDLVLDRLLRGLAEMDGCEIGRLPDGLSERRRRRLLFRDICVLCGHRE